MCLSFRSTDVHKYNTYSENINPASRLLEGYHRLPSSYIGIYIPHIRLKYYSANNIFKLTTFTQNYLAYLIFFNHLVAYKFKNFIMKMNNKTVFLPACGYVEEVHRVCCHRTRSLPFLRPHICKPTIFFCCSFFICCISTIYTPKRGC